MYDFDKIVNRVGTDCIKWDFRETEYGEDVLPMFIADMDFETLPQIREAMEKRLAQNIYGYTLTPPTYYTALIDWMERRHHLSFTKDDVIMMPTIDSGAHLCVQTFTKEDEAVVVFTPSYAAFLRAVKANERPLIEIPLLNTDGYYTIDFDAFEDACKNKNAKMLILCNPFNPCARAWTKEELERLVAICKAYDVKIYSDEIHQDFVYAPYVYTPTSMVNEDAKNLTITATGPGKTFNVAGLRICNIIINNEALRNAFKKTMGRHGIAGPNMLAVAGLEAAYTYGDEWVDELVAYVKGNLDLCETTIKEKMPELVMTHHESLYLAWIDFRKLGMDTPTFEKWLRQEARVQPNDGAWFGEAGVGFARINVACPRSQVQLFLDNLEKAVKKLR